MAKRKVKTINKKTKTTKWHGPKVTFIRGRKPDPCEKENSDCAEC